MDHGDMDHGDMEMAPEGVPLAGGGDDRDGLEMDVLHVPLGPVLPHWPAGLVLRCTLHGDVIASAAAELVGADASHEPGDDASHEPGERPDERPDDRPDDRDDPSRQQDAAVRLDNAASLLALAGWPDAAMRAERLRDALVTGRPAAELAPEVSALRRKVGRSRLLRWSLGGIRPIDEEERADEEWPAHWTGDVHRRLLALLDRAVDALDEAAHPEPAGTPGNAGAGTGIDGIVPVESVAALVTGLDLATARLVVASLDLDPPRAVREAARA